MRSNQTGTTKVTYLVSDHHGTSHLAINRDSTLTFTKRYTTPFGADRGKAQYGPWPDDKGFLGKTRDATTGLTHIDAREYDPTIGQFISVDPLLEAGKPQTLNGYSYAANNPITYSDPTGTRLADCEGGWNECGPGGNGGIVDRGPVVDDDGTVTIDDDGSSGDDWSGCTALCQQALDGELPAKNPSTIDICGVTVSNGCDAEFRERVIRAYKGLTVFDDYYNCTFHQDESACDVAGSAFSSGGATWASSILFGFFSTAKNRLAKGVDGAGVVVTREDGLAAAAAAKGTFKEPGGTNGALFVEGHDGAIPVSSGLRNRPDDYVDPPGVSSVNREHAETHAVAIMREKGWSNADLYIDQDYICGPCMQRLDRMLPKGATLRVTFRDSGGDIHTETFGLKN
jgi:RHS repeat-associated protein